MSGTGVPKAIIIVGASRTKAKYGNRAVRAYVEAGATVFPVNPKSPEIEGLPAYASVTDVPAGKTTVASLYAQPEVIRAALPELKAYGVTDVYFNPGTEDPALVQQARDLGLHPILACSITAIGRNPEAYV